MWSIEQVNARAGEWIDAFSALAAKVPYESKGILFQEAFFLYACLAGASPRRVIESGRARGQSTLMLGLCFPKSAILSIEFDRHSKDVPVAERRLENLPHVQLLYGDARRMIPPMLEQGDVVVIDGPKEHRALALAYRVLGTGLCPVVFVHDCYQGSPIRRLIESTYPGAFFSDDPSFVAAYRHLDEARVGGSEGEKGDDWRPYSFAGVPQASWGPTFACLPFAGQFRYRSARGRVWFEATRWRLRRSLAKHSGGLSGRCPPVAPSL